MKKLSQKAEIRNYLENGGKLTALAALNFWNCLNCKGRIYDIREDYADEWDKQPPGNKKPMQEIKTEMVKTKSGKMIGLYYIEKFD